MKKLAPYKGAETATQAAIGVGLGLGILAIIGIGWAAWRKWGPSRSTSATGATDQGTTTGTTSKKGKTSEPPPPNVSGDPKGYNTTMFPGPLAMRIVIKGLGYDMPISDQPLGEAESEALSAFQRDYNKVSDALTVGRTLQLPNEDELEDLRGQLAEDGAIGPLTLRGVELASYVAFRNLTSWSDVVARVDDLVEGPRL